MECVYKHCNHDSNSSSCSFFTLPFDECKLKIWKRYAKFSQKHLQSVKNARLCSCHFIDEDPSNSPIPFVKKKQISSSDETGKKLKARNARGNTAEHPNPIDNFIHMFDVDDDDFIPNSSHIRIDASSILDPNSFYLIESEIPTSELNGVEHLLTCSSKSQANDSKKLVRVQKENVKLKQLNEQLTESQVHDSMQLVRVQKDNDKLKSLNEQLTEAQVHDSKKLLTLQKENAKLKQLNEQLTHRLVNMNLSFEFKFIEHSDEKIFMHTGLPNRAIFNLVFDIMSRFKFEYAAKWNVTKIPKKTQFLMVMMKLRMDLRNFDLCERFGFSETTASNIFRTWVFAMHEILFLQLMKDIPSRWKNKECLPVAFESFKDCRIILDCTEMFTDKPKKMDNQKSVYSPYKHHVTAKGLIGVAPCGVVTYASQLYVGSLSDKKIFQHCRLKEKFDVGDMLLADKGFLIREDLPYGVNLNIPPFLTTPQFTKEQVRLTELIARGRIHVERAVNKMKNFRMLRFIPAELFSISNQIFQVCAALTNFQHPLVREVAHDF